MTAATPGQALYARYAAAMESQGVGVDDWDDLSEHDRTAWGAIALPQLPEKWSEPQPAPRDLDDLFAEALATFTAQGQPAPDPSAAMRETASRELTAAMAEARVLREQYATLLEQFHGSGSAGWSLRLSGVVLSRRYRDAGIPLPERLKHLEGK